MPGVGGGGGAFVSIVLVSPSDMLRRAASSGIALAVEARSRIGGWLLLSLSVSLSWPPCERKYVVRGGCYTPPTLAIECVVAVVWGRPRRDVVQSTDEKGFALMPSLIPCATRCVLVAILACCFAII